MLTRAFIPAAAAAVLVAAPAHAAPVSTAFTTVGASVFTVPAGVHAVDVSLTGARGGHTYIDSGGRGALVRSTLPVTPGTRLYAVVGGAGTDFRGGNGSTFNSGGANGGGYGFAGGGGASDIRTEPPASPTTLASRIVVAAGGGGAGEYSSGGDAGAPGGSVRGVAYGGKPGTQSAGGAGGTAGPGGENGTAGSLGLGGNGMAPNFRGGGGGGGLYGGGGGAGEGPCSSCGFQGGGGGGSSLVPVRGTFGLAALTEAAQVTIAYDAPAASLDTTRLEFPATQPGAVSPGRTIELANSTRATDLTVASLSLASDDFLVGATTCDTVAAGEKCRVSVRYAPSAHGRHDAKLRISSNAGTFEVDLTGESVAPAPVVATPAAPVATTRLKCSAKRCAVVFAAAPAITKNGTRVRATLAQGGRVFASADFKARRGSLKLVLKNRRAVKPGTYTLTLQIGAKKTTGLARR
jgi:hypothetical protein